MLTRRRIWLTLSFLCVAWLAFVGMMYAKSRSGLRDVGEQLYMPERTFYIAGDPLAPDDHLPGDERLLVVGKGAKNYILASIVRNERFSDFRAQWKVDYCIGGNPDFENGWLILWEPHDKFPTEQDIATFRRIASTKRFVIWGTPEGSSPSGG